MNKPLSLLWLDFVVNKLYTRWAGSTRRVGLKRSLFRLLMAVHAPAGSRKGAAMADLTSQDQQQARQAFEEALRSDQSQAAVSMTGGKEIFCDNWPVAKQVLQFLKGFAPKWLQPIIDLIITAGDKLHDGNFCKAQGS